jgi:hypothetical protein
MLNRYSALLAAAVLSIGLTGCNNSDNTTPTASTPGPAQRTGAAVDNAARNTADAAHDAANRTGAAMDRAADRTAAGMNNAADRTSNAVNNAADRTRDAADRTTAGVNSTVDRTRTTSTDTNNTSSGSAANNNNTGAASNLPGMPSVTGTSTSDMSTADAAAQRLIDNARSNLKENDVSKAKTLVSELKQQGMYDSLSSTMKAKVDQLEKDVNAAPGATAQENK